LERVCATCIGARGLVHGGAALSSNQIEATRLVTEVFDGDVELDANGFDLVQARTHPRPIRSNTGRSIDDDAVELVVGMCPGWNQHYNDGPKKVAGCSCHDSPSIDRSIYRKR